MVHLQLALHQRHGLSGPGLPFEVTHVHGGCVRADVYLGAGASWSNGVPGVTVHQHEVIGQGIKGGGLCVVYLVDKTRMTLRAFFVVTETTMINDFLNIYL